MLVPLFGTIVGGGDWLLSRSEGPMISAWLGTSPIVLGILAALGLAFIWLLQHTVRIQKQIDPEIRITFGGEPPWVHRVPASIDLGEPKGIVRTEAIYVRFKVENVTPKSVVRGCEAFLVKVCQRNQSGEFIEVSSGDSFKLPWAAKPRDKLHAAIPIPYSVNTFCDLLFVDKIKNRISVQWDVHLNLNLEIFSAIGVYRFDVLVISERGGPVTKSIYLDWPGQWDQIRTWVEE